MPPLEWYHWIVIVILGLVMLAHARWIVTGVSVVVAYKVWLAGGDSVQLIGVFVGWLLAIGLLSNFGGGFFASDTAYDDQQKQNADNHQRREFNKRF